MAGGGAIKIFHFHSHLAKRMENFVALRRLSGTDYLSQTRLLSYFDRFLVKEKFDKPCLTCEIVESYLSGLSHLHPRSRYNRFSVLSQFCRYLSGFEPLCYLPKGFRAAKETSRTPYIFTKRQISALLAEAAKLQPEQSLRPNTYHTLFGLLYTTGLRIGEALALNIKDFYPDSMLLYIRQGKFHKSRWVPLVQSICAVLQTYIQKRNNTLPLQEDAPLFVSLRNRRLSHCNVNQTFCYLLKKCRIHKSKDNGPRIHDFRHYATK